jgi:hypothetical protein
MAKITKDIQFKMLNDAINNGSDYNKPKFVARYYVIKMDNGAREILRELPGSYGVVSHHIIDGLTADILTYCRTVASGNMAFNTITYDTAKTAAKDWLHSAEPVDKPAMVLFKDEPGLCYHRLPFKPCLEMDTPLFDELMGRCSDAMALKCFIGSIFVPESDRQQYLWMYGGGRNGKGCMIRLLNKLLGSAVMPKIPPNQNTIRFWMYSLLGKRLITMSDCDVQDFVTQGEFKMLTGGDLVPIEVKGGSEFSADLACKFLIASNDKPEVTRQLSDMRRAIYVTFDPIPCEPDGTYESRLWLEAPGIVARCLECYEEQVGPNHGSIPTNNDALDDLIEENESEMQELFDRYFDLDEDDTKPVKDRYMFSGDELIRLMRDVYGNNFKKKRSEFIKFLQNKYNIVRKTVPTVVNKRYVGAKRNGIYSMKRMMMTRQDVQLQADIWSETEDQKDE